jgi:hypothetical protein
MGVFFGEKMFNFGERNCPSKKVQFWRKTFGEQVEVEEKSGVLMLTYSHFLFIHDVNYLKIDDCAAVHSPIILLTT